MIEHIENEESGASVRGKLNALVDGANVPFEAGQLTMQGNTTQTVIAQVATPVKVAGTAAAGPLNTGFAISNARLEYDGDHPGMWYASAVVTLTGGNNDQLTLRFARNGTICDVCAGRVVMPPAARPLTTPIIGIFPLAKGDFIEVFVQNNSDTDNVTVTNLAVTLTRLPGAMP